MPRLPNLDRPGHDGIIVRHDTERHRAHDSTRLRSLSRPVLTVVALIALGLGIGAKTEGIVAQHGVQSQ